MPSTARSSSPSSTPTTGSDDGAARRGHHARPAASRHGRSDALSEGAGSRGVRSATTTGPRLAKRLKRRALTRPRSGVLVAGMTGVAALTILITRVALALSGYPQVGGSEFHIAHAVWGGLLLMIALSLVLALANRWAYPTAAVLGGVGIGLFLDEIGKFITQDNDYFHPLAAPLCYTLLALLGAAGLLLDLRSRRGTRGNLYALLEDMKFAADGPMTAGQLAKARKHLSALEDDELSEQQSALVAGLRDAVDEAAEHVAEGDDAAWTQRLTAWLVDHEARTLPLRRARRLGRGLLVVLTLICLIAGPGLLALSVWQLMSPAPLGGVESPIGQHPATTTWMLAAIAAALGIAAGVLAWLAIVRLAPDASNERLTSGTELGIAALLLMLGGVNVVAAYYSQFLILGAAAVQSLAITILARFRTRVRPSEA